MLVFFARTHALLRQPVHTPTLLNGRNIFCSTLLVCVSVFLFLLYSCPPPSPPFFLVLLPFLTTFFSSFLFSPPLNFLLASLFFFLLLSAMCKTSGRRRCCCCGCCGYCCLGVPLRRQCMYVAGTLLIITRGIGGGGEEKRLHFLLSLLNPYYGRPFSLRRHWWRRD